MARYIQPVMGPDYGKLILQGLGAFRQVKGIQRNQAQDAQTAEIKDLSARVNTDPEAMARLAVLDPTRAASLKRMQRLDAQDAETADIKSLSGQAMTDEESLAQLAALDPQKAAAIAQMQKQKRDEQTANEERFRKERAIMAGDMQGQDPATRIAILDKHIAKVVERGGDPSNSQGLRDLYASNDPEQIKKANVFVNNALQQGYREGFIKPVPQQKSGTLRQNLVEAGYEPGTPEYTAAARKQLEKKSGTTVNVGKGQSSFEVALSKSLVKRLENVRESGDQADEELYNLDTVEAIDVKQGAFEPMKMQIAALGEGLGIDMSNLANVAAGQAYQAKAASMVLDKMAAQAGPQTESDMRQIRTTVTRLGNTPEANKFLIRSARALALRKRERRDFYDSYLEEHGTTKGASKEWNNYIRKVPMISPHRKTKDGLPIFYHEFEKKMREAHPGASRDDIIETWNYKEKKKGPAAPEPRSVPVLPRLSINTGRATGLQGIPKGYADAERLSGMNYPTGDQ